MYQRKDEAVSEPDTVAPEERAYEDNWYRSLKALAEARQDEDAGSEHLEDAEDAADAPAVEGPAVEGPAVEAPAVDVGPVQVASEAPVPPQVDGSEPAAAEPVAGVATTERERLVSEEFETRAGQLLERLRSIQHLGDR